MVVQQVKKLWRWKPSAATTSNDEGGTVTSAGVAGVDSTTAVSAFMRGLSQRLGLGENTRDVRVRLVRRRDFAIERADWGYRSIVAEVLSQAVAVAITASIAYRTALRRMVIGFRWSTTDDVD